MIPDYRRELLNEPMLQRVREIGGFRVLGPCVIFHRLGRGDVGISFLAYHLLLKTDVVVKCFFQKPSFAEPDTCEAFRSRARIAAEKLHKARGFSAIHHNGNDDGVIHVVREFVAGESLAERWKRKGQIAIREALLLSLRLARSIAWLHRNGMVHGGLKLENVFVAPPDTLYLTDVLTGGSPSGFSWSNPWESERTARTFDAALAAQDVRDAGAIIFRLVAGQVAFVDEESSNPGRAVRALSSFRANVPPSFSDSVAALCNAIPNGPIRDGRDMLKAMEQLASDIDQHARLRDPGVGDRTSVIRDGRRPNPSEIHLITTGRLEIPPTAIWNNSGRAKPRMQLPEGTVAATGTQMVDDTHPREVIHLATGVELVYVHSGEFERGTGSGAYEAALSVFRQCRPHETEESFFGDQRHVRIVRLTRPFYVSKYQVRSGAYLRWEMASRSRPENAASNESFPATMVSWNDAVEFCRSNGMRLLTEAEWEYAARGGTQGIFPWGDDYRHASDHANVLGRKKWKNLRLSGSCFPFDDKFETLSPVGRFRANGFGLFDTVGNVWEWCSDWYDHAYYGSPFSLMNPQGPATGECRVLRGGSWRSDPAECLVSYRHFMEPETQRNTIGFRVAMDAPE